jgi:hypothetical protein
LFNPRTLQRKQFSVALMDVLKLLRKMELLEPGITRCSKTLMKAGASISKDMIAGSIPSCDSRAVVGDG